MIDFKQMTDDEQTATAACEEWSNGEPAVTTQEEELSFKEGFKRGLRHERKVTNITQCNKQENGKYHIIDTKIRDRVRPVDEEVEG
jgi:hypothetical protein